MLIDKLVVKGLKSLKDVTFRFDKFSIIIGKNDIGKSSTLRALDIFLNDLKPNRDEITFGHNKLEISLIFKLSKEELEKQEIIDLVGSYLIDNNKLHITKVFVVDAEDNTKVKTAEVYVNNKEKLKPAEWKKIQQYLPQFIYIESIRDIDKATKMNSNSILGKLMMPLILKQKTLSDEIQGLKNSISTNIESVVKDIENFLKEQSPDVNKLITKSEITLEKAVELNFFVDDGYSTTSIGRKGSGVQSSLIVSLFRAYAKHHISKNIVFGIEEPDVYLHVGAQRKIFHSLQSVTQNAGQVILTTHSTVFIDRGNLKGITLLKRDKQGDVVAKRIKKDTDISVIQENLDIRNSDWFQWDAVLMVEGATERTVIDIWARKLGINLDSIGIKILVIGGKDKAYYFANAKILDDLEIPYAVLLDSDEKNPEEYRQYLVNNTNLQEENCFILRKREIENYYPIEAIKNAFPEADLSKISFGDHEDVKEQLRAILNKTQETIGRKVAEAMSVEQIPSEVKSAIEYLRDKILQEENQTILQEATQTLRQVAVAREL
ncbi:ATP-dependent nuclease [Parageobacillus toebii]|uniref:ATP-dependent nuclease n=1 Tax=Parageobacillus toebii TaxID=153151 RepID=UPI002E1EBF10|nr:AAA family ATPase [Parageobacillus toebii]